MPMFLMCAIHLKRNLTLIRNVIAKAPLEMFSNGNLQTDIFIDNDRLFNFSSFSFPTHSSHGGHLHHIAKSISFYFLELCLELRVCLLEHVTKHIIWEWGKNAYPLRSNKTLQFTDGISKDGTGDIVFLECSYEARATSPVSHSTRNWKNSSCK